MLRFADIKRDITYLSPVLLLPTVLEYFEGVTYNPLRCKQKGNNSVIIGKYIIYELTVIS